MAEDPSRPYSSVIVDGVTRAPSRAMLRAVGFDDADFSRPQVGIASTWSQVTPCNVHIDGLAEEAAKGVSEGGGKGVIFNTITVSDGMPGVPIEMPSEIVMVPKLCGFVPASARLAIAASTSPWMPTLHGVMLL